MRLSNKFGEESMPTSPSTRVPVSADTIIFNPTPLPKVNREVLAQRVSADCNSENFH
jgi:hypothetical protein